jgi:hypothetical protein
MTSESLRIAINYARALNLFESCDSNVSSLSTTPGLLDTLPLLLLANLLAMLVENVQWPSDHSLTQDYLCNPKGWSYHL